MAKYIKIPVEIDAISVELLLYQFKHDWNKLPDWVDKAYAIGIINTITDEGFIIKTLEGDMKATKNDMLIKGIEGELYPCKIDIFNKTYEEPKTMAAVENEKEITLEDKLIQLKSLIEDIMNKHSIEDITIYKEEETCSGSKSIKLEIEF